MTTAQQNEARSALDVAGGSLPVPASEILRVASALEDNARQRDAVVAVIRPERREALKLEAQAIREAAKIIRRHVAAKMKRPPEENAEISHAEEKL